MTYFTKSEDAILIRYYETEGPSGLLEFLPHRTKDAIRHRARKLGLKSTKKRGPSSPTRVFRFRASRVPEEDFLRLKAQIPDDTRDLTGRLCGDPLPGRSALDRLGGTGA